MVPTKGRTEDATEFFGEAQVHNVHMTYRMAKDEEGGFSIFVKQVTKDGTLTRTLRDISRNEQAAQDFFRRLCEGGVTLLHLDDVVEDFLAE